MVTPGSGEGPSASNAPGVRPTPDLPHVSEAASDTPPDPPSGDIAAASPIVQVLNGIRELSEAMDRYRHGFGASHELGTAEVTALAHLLYTEHTTAGHLATRTNLTPGAATALMDRLERRGYITRNRPATNRRSLIIELTESGRRLAQSMFAPLFPLLERASAEPDTPEPQPMAHCLERIAEMINSLADAAATS